MSDQCSAEHQAAIARTVVELTPALYDKGERYYDLHPLTPLPEASSELSLSDLSDSDDSEASVEETNESAVLFAALFPNSDSPELETEEFLTPEEQIAILETQKEVRINPYCNFKAADGTEDYAGAPGFYEDSPDDRILTSKLFKQVSIATPFELQSGASFDTDEKVRRAAFVLNLGLRTVQRLDKLTADEVSARNIEIDDDCDSDDETMSRLPQLKMDTGSLPEMSAEEARDTASPARGAAMKANIFNKLRVPDLPYKWAWWGEGTGAGNAPTTAATYENQLRELEEVGTIKEFWQCFNNSPLDGLKLRSSWHLFHKGIKPVWEDPRNARGGAWYFRVPKEIAPGFWRDVCLLAVGDTLQGAVQTDRPSFNDEICGVSYSVRWNAVQIAVWNRDAENEEGKEKVLETILTKIGEEVKPKKDTYYYKKHADHKGFNGTSS